MHSLTFERRHSARAPLAVPVRFLVPGRTVRQGHSVDLAPGGILLSTEHLEEDFVEHLLRNGGRLNLELNLFLATVLVHGRVVDMEVSDTGRDYLHVAFDALPAAEGSRLEDFLMRHWIGIERCRTRPALA